MTNDEVHAFLERFGYAWRDQDLVTLAGCGYDTLKIRFPGPVRDADRLARRIFKLGPSEQWRPDEISVLAGGRPTRTCRAGRRRRWW